MFIMSEETTFNELREKMQEEAFSHTFYKNIKKFRDYHHKGIFKQDYLEIDEGKLGKYTVDAFCIVFCDIEEYADQMGVEKNGIKQRVASALKGDDNKTKDVNTEEIEVLRKHSEKYKIGQIKDLLADFCREMNYKKVSKNADGLYNCVKEVIRRFNSDNWEFKG
ncbi:MAG TPA: hypothetical protein VKZ77_04965 [Bacillaceae bacterium]|nr:hypothetical protein [Bacillaceae bacterium]